MLCQPQYFIRYVLQTDQWLIEARINNRESNDSKKQKGYSY
jgi:hypothetical protein